MFPGLFDSTMMSRLALYPLAGAVILLLGRERAGLRHIMAGSLLAAVPFIFLIRADVPVTGMPFAVRLASFGMMVAGFSGTVAKWGLKKHLEGLAAAAAIVSITILLTGADRFSGNPNRTGMLLALGLVASASGDNRRRSIVLGLLIVPGLVATSFYISWVAAALGIIVLLTHRRFSVDPALLICAMIAGQLAFTMVPGMSDAAGPTLRLRSHIWKTSMTQFVRTFPLGTGTGQARLSIYSEGGDALQELAGPDRRVDYLHSEPLSIAVEFGAAGLAMLVLFILWTRGRGGSRAGPAMLAASWVILTSDLPLATPLGALPAALVLGGFLSRGRSVRIPMPVPLLLIALSFPWAYVTVKGYRALNRTGDPQSSMEACRFVPFEERAFLRAGWDLLRAGEPLSALAYSRRFTEMYPCYHGGWELQATILGVLGRHEESASAWRRTLVLAPGDHDEVCLFALNSIPFAEASGDTLLSVGEALSRRTPWWYEGFPDLDQRQFPTVARRCYRLAVALRQEDPYLAGMVFSRAVIASAAAAEPAKSDLLDRGAAMYPDFEGIVPGDQDSRVRTLLGTRI